MLSATTTHFTKEYLKTAEHQLHLEYEEEIKFDGFVIIDGKTNLKFKPSNPNSSLLPFSSTAEDLIDLIDNNIKKIQNN